MSEGLFCVKMRASVGGRHISGAERIVEGGRVCDVARAMVERVKAPYDFMNIKVEAAWEVLRLPALPVSTHEVSTPEEGWSVAERILRDAGFARTSEILSLFAETYPMRGAMLLDADSLERLEPDRERGVRATCMDSEPSPPVAAKNHFAEALTLATKVQAAPGIVAEICVSDDADYVTGYVATHAGYHRITVLKRKGSPLGGRIFLYRGRREDVAETIRYLEKTPVVVFGGAASAPRQSSRFAGLVRDLDDIERAGLKREIRVFGADCVETPFASNDYLALACDDRVAAAAADAAKRFGAGAGASRMVTGTIPPHVHLERHIAAFKHCEDALLFPTGYMANLGAISALVRRGDVVLSDELNHASIIDGCRLSGAQIVIYRHLDMDDLERHLKGCGFFRRRLVVSDGVFSMDGDVLDLPRFVDICQRHDAFSYVDEAHSIGVMGATGRGLAEHFGGCDAPDFSMGTLSKALGSQGGYVAGSRTAVEFLRQKARTFIFSTAPNPASAAAADAALTILESEPQRVARLRENVRLFCETAGVPVSPSAIVPIVIGDERKALEAAAALEAAGFVIPAIRYPTVALGMARLRVAIGAGHTREQIVSAAKAARSLA